MKKRIKRTATGRGFFQFRDSKTGRFRSKRDYISYSNLWKAEKEKPIFIRPKKVRKVVEKPVEIIDKITEIFGEIRGYEEREKERLLEEEVREEKPEIYEFSAKELKEFSEDYKQGYLMVFFNPKTTDKLEKMYEKEGIKGTGEPLKMCVENKIADFEIPFQFALESQQDVIPMILNQALAKKCYDNDLQGKVYIHFEEWIY